MAFLTWILKSFLDWLLGKLLGVIAIDQKDKTNHEKAVNQAAQDSKPAKELKPDATKEEIDTAIDDSFKHI